MGGNDRTDDTAAEDRLRARYGAVIDLCDGGFLDPSWVNDALTRARQERAFASAAIRIARQLTDESARLWTEIARDHRRSAAYLERTAMRFRLSRIPRHLNFGLVREAEEAALSAVERLGWEAVDQRPDDREPPPGLPPSTGPPPRQLTAVHAPCCGVPAPPISWA